MRFEISEEQAEADFRISNFRVQNRGVPARPRPLASLLPGVALADSLHRPATHVKASGLEELPAPRVS